MSKSKCKVIIIGNLGADPEIRYTQNSTAIANLSVATTESWKDKQTGEQREQTEWHRIVCYRKVAEIASNYLRKGSKVYLEGRLQTRKWQGQDGKDNYATEIVCNELILLDSNPNTNTGQNAGQGQQRGQQSGHQGGRPAPQQTGFGGQQGQQPRAPQGGFGGQSHQQAPQGGQPHQQGGFNGPSQGGFGGPNGY